MIQASNHLRKALFIAFLCLTGCSEMDNSSSRIQNQKGEFLYRMHNEFFFLPEPAEKSIREPYPWEKDHSNLPRITKEYFRCKGSQSNPVRIVDEKGESKSYFDCGGTARHSLPYRDDKEFIYPVLIDILTFIQNKTGQRVCITSGHRCPEHNAYVDPSSNNRYSKHMIGAEVSFYVQGLEQKPETILNLIQNYYKSKYNQPEYTEFKLYEKNDTDVSTPPILNKEIFVKLYKKHEGRNFDNRHPYPYISIQVRWDKDKQEKVAYSWEQATQNYQRR